MPDGIRIPDLPNLGTATDDSSFVVDHAGSGRFTGTAIKTWLANSFLLLAGGTVTGNAAIQGTVLLGTGVPHGTPYKFQAAYDIALSAAPADTRQSMFWTTLNIATDTTNIWENMNSFVTVSGPGHANGEINLAHTYFQVNSGGNALAVEGYEASALNNGVIGAYSNYLGIFNNGPTGTSTALYGVSLYLTNQNTTPGSIGEWDAINVGAMQGGGARPTFYNALRVADVNAGIVTVGGINIGSLANAIPNTLFIKGADNSAGTFPFIFQNLAGSVFDLDNSGSANFRSAGVVVGPNLGGIINITAPDTNAAHFALNVRNSAATLLFNLGNSGIANFSAAGVLMQPTAVGPNLFVQGTDNSSGSFPLSIKNLAAVSLIAVSNSGVIQAGVAGQSFTIPGNLITPSIDNGGIVGLTVFATAAKGGFFGTTPIVKPTGVAVTAAGVHAALVSLGLIAA